MIIYCPDNFELLNKLRKDLIEVGYIDDPEWNTYMINNHIKDPITNLSAYPHSPISFYTIGHFDVEKPLYLTESNYTTILKQLKDAL